MKKSIILLLHFLLFYPALSQYSINNYVISYGQFYGTGSGYTLMGTVGQPGIGTSNVLGANTFQSGFWYGALNATNTLTLTTATVTNIQNTSAIAGGNVSENGSSVISSYGIIYGTSSNPELAASSTTINTNGTISGTFTKSLTGLIPGTTYYVKAFATNSVGTTLGSQVSFTTNPNLPVTWQNVGLRGFSAGQASYTSMAIDGNGNKYVVYSDVANGYKATVMKFNGTSWTNVGTAGFSAGQASYTSIAIDGSGNIYVAYMDGGNLNKATVMKYNGSSWGLVGTAGFSANSVYYTSIAIDGSGYPNVAYQDYNVSYKATVMKYNGTSWGLVGTAGFSANYAYYTSIAIDGSGNPLVAYMDGENYNYATVMKFSAGTWGLVGSAGFSTGQADYTTIKIDANGTPYIGYRDAGNSYKATMMKFSAGTWGLVGTAGFSAGQADYISMAFDGSGTPFIGYMDAANNNKATVMKYSSGYWELVGTAGFSGGTAGYTSIAVDGNGTPFVAYQDAANSNKATVMVFPGAPTVSTAAVTNIQNNSVSSGGNITYDGGSPISRYGIIYGISPNPELSGSSVTISTIGSVSGTFTKSLTGLNPETTYYVKAFATNSVATTLGSQVSFTTLPNTWQNLGSAGFSAAAAGYTSIAIDGNGTRYVVFADEANSNKVTVMKYNGSSWVNVGNPAFSAGQADYTKIVIDGSCTPYIVFQDWGNSKKATVMKYNGSSWVNVGSAGFSSGQADYTSMAIDGSGTPFVVFKDWGNSKKATMMKYNGSSWVNVGSAGFSPGLANYTSIVIDGSGTPFVVFRGNSNKATVMKYSGGFWTLVGSQGFSAGEAYFPSIALDGNGTPYVVYVDNAHYNKATVMKYDGSSWVNVGNPGFSAGTTVAYTSITIDGNGTPYIEYLDAVSYDKVTVMKYSSGTWSVVGSAGFSAGSASWPSIALDGSGTPFVVYQDGGNSNKATVMFFPGAPTVSTTSITNIQNISAKCGGNVSNDGSSPINARGLCWGTSANPTISNSSVTVSGTTGTFSADLTGLTASTTYFVRAFATNSAGTSYGNQQWFSTTAMQAGMMLEESFDGTSFASGWSFPPALWSLLPWKYTGFTGSYYWMNRFSNPIAPTISAAHSGSYFAHFDCWNIPQGEQSALISPALDFSARNNRTIRVRFWMYRSNEYPSYDDTLQVAINTSPSVLGMTRIGSLHVEAARSPVVSSNGWYNYYFDVPSSFTGSSNYIIFLGCSGYGDGIGLDDVQVYYPSDESYASSAAAAAATASAGVAIGSTNQAIIKALVTINGELNPLNVTNMTFSTNGTTNVSDITQAKLYFTGTSNSFSTGTLLGAVVAPNGSFSFNINQSLTGGLGSTNNYFWIAYDVSSNATPGNYLAANFNSVTIAGTAYTPNPQTATPRVIVGPMHGTYTVGLGGNYSTLNEAMADVAARGMDGNTNLQIISNIVEPKTVVVPIPTYIGGAWTVSITTAGNYEVQVNAGGSLGISTLNSGPSQSVIYLSPGLSNFYLDGGTGRMLTLRNTNTTNTNAFGVVMTPITNPTVSTTFTNITIKSCNIVNSNTATGNYFYGLGIYLTSSLYTSNNVTIDNNNIVGAGMSSTGSYYYSYPLYIYCYNQNNWNVTNNLISKGYYSVYYYCPSASNTTNINNNTIQSSYSYGMYVYTSSATNLNINSNTFGNLTDNVNTVQYMALSLGGTLISANVNNNTFQNIGATSYNTSTRALYYSVSTASTLNGTNISYNKFNRIQNNYTNGCSSIGLYVAGGNGTIIHHNSFTDITGINYGGAAMTASYGAAAIFLASGYGTKFYYNTVNMATSTNNTGIAQSASAALLIAGGSSIYPHDIRNNIFHNTMTHNIAGSKSYSIYAATSNANWTTCNYNDLYAGGPNAVLGYYLTAFNGTNDQNTLANWQAATARDANSVNIPVTFSSGTDCHLAGNSSLDYRLNCPKILTYALNDIDSYSRKSTTNIGADEAYPNNLSLSQDLTLSPNLPAFCAGSSASLSFGISYNGFEDGFLRIVPNPNFYLSWYKNLQVINGQQSYSMNFSPLTQSDAGNYYATVSYPMAGLNATTSTRIINFETAMSFTSQPSSTVHCSSDLNLNLNATPAGSYTDMQWQIENPAGSGNYLDIQGQTNSNLQMTFSDGHNAAGKYRLKLTGPGNCGASTTYSNVAEITNADPLVGINATTNISDPLHACVGTDIYLTCNGSGSISSCQWQYSTDGSSWNNLDPNIFPTSTSQIFYLQNPQSNLSGLYSCSVSGSTACTPSNITTNSIFLNISTYLPSISSYTVTNILNTSAISSGNVTNEGCVHVTQRGIVWSNLPTPTLTSNESGHTSNGTGIGYFSGSITGLNPLTTYYVRAYAINSVGTSYGNEHTFTTISTPFVSSPNILSLQFYDAYAGANVNSDGGAPVTSRGLVWSSSMTPTLVTNEMGHSLSGSGTGPFTGSINGLYPATTYYISAFATNVCGTGYGNVLTFTTPAPLPASNIVFTQDKFGAITFNWTNGTGDKRLVLMGLNSQVAWTPTNHNPINNIASTNWNAASELAFGQRLIANGAVSNTITVINVPPGDIWVRIYEYVGTGTSTYYVLNTSDLNPKQINKFAFSTIASPQIDGTPFLLNINAVNRAGTPLILINDLPLSISASDIVGTCTIGTISPSSATIKAPASFTIAPVSWNNGGDGCSTGIRQIQVSAVNYVSSYSNIFALIPPEPTVQANTLILTSPDKNTISMKRAVAGDGLRTLVVAKANQSPCLVSDGMWYLDNTGSSGTFGLPNSVLSDGLSYACANIDRFLPTSASVFIGGFACNTNYYLRMYNFNGSRNIYLPSGWKGSTYHPVNYLTTSSLWNPKNKLTPMCKEAGGYSFEFLGMNLRSNNKQVNVSWQTAMEAGIVGYELFRAEFSEDSTPVYSHISSYKSNYHLKAHNQTNEMSYLYIDNDPALEVGKLYIYKLIYVAFEGCSNDLAEDITGILSTSNEGTARIVISEIAPNPSYRLIEFKMENSEVQKVSIDIIDMSGKQAFIYCQDLSYIKGSYDVMMNLEHLVSGTYMLRVIGENETIVNKFVIVR
ncbi:MAG: hypothetical protein NT007_16660 [Candidatus Kapabacteria bacterium]|nr:hypothetical protein [Candidatus Kapabacteria bacterium]